MKGFTALHISLLVMMLALLVGCASLPGTALFPQDDESNELSAIERQERARLLAGQSSRPSLASLNLLPQGRGLSSELEADIESTSSSSNESNRQSTEEAGAGIPQLSLEKKKAEYEALLPLISDPIQRQQAAFRLADINMLLAERALEQGVVLQGDVAKDKAQNEALQDGTIRLPQSPFAEAIDSYRKVIAAHQILQPSSDKPLTQAEQALNRKQMDARYQLSRALDLSGQKSESVEAAKSYLDTFAIETFGINEQHIELQFRIGEYYFNRSQYQLASQYYDQVVTNYQIAQLQNSQNFYSISTYMLGWSEFKQDKYNEALAAFDLMLSDTFAQATPSQTLRLDEIDFLSIGEMRLVRDSIRIMALTFSYQGSGQAIVDFYQPQRYKQQKRQGASLLTQNHYKHLIFEELAQQYLDEDRFNESARALLVFAQNNPLHARAVEFYVRHIDAYILGGFPEKVLMAKRGFVEAYSLGNGIVKRLDSPIGQTVTPYLSQYLVELAQTEHSIAQGIDGILQARAQNADLAVDASSNTLQNGASQQAFVSANLSRQMRNVLTNASTEDLYSLRIEGYEQAIAYYENYIRTFGPATELDEKVPQLRFYMAEANMSLKRYEDAIVAFEIYAYEDSPNPLDAEAAYAAILAYDMLISEAPAGDTLNSELTTDKQTSTALKGRAQKSQERFILSFADDRRAPVVALALMQTLFNDTEYMRAQRWARWFLDTAPNLHALDSEVTRSANLVMAHSEFALEQYASAESYYRLLLTNYQTNEVSGAIEQNPALNEASSRADLIDRLAATLYRQAEQELALISLTPAELSEYDNAYDLSLSDAQESVIIKAIGFWQAIINDTPSSAFRVAAQFDSASYYALLGQWDNAIDLWLDFAQRYPNDPLTIGIDGNLLYAYQQTENWEEVARLLIAQWNADKQSDEGREALYQAAVFYERAENRERALDTFRTYAHAYPSPLAMANEARYRLSEYYLASNEDTKRRFWLKKILEAQLSLAQQGGANSDAGTPRSRYLAALSAMVFANDADAAFSRIKLTLPLNESLSQKQAALSEAISAYDQVMSFAVAQFTSEANYKLANLYMQLAQDLMDSARPTELSALELSQYDILLEEQAYPFEEKAIELHETNVGRVLGGLYDNFVKRSFAALSKTLPARYNKQEMMTGVNPDDL